VSIRITDHTGPVIWQYIHDDAPAELGGPHGGSMNAADVQYATNPHTGLPDYDAILTPCPQPGCGSVSSQPAGGGADPRGVQELFVRLAIRDRAMTVQQAIDDAKARCTRMDGPGRWQVDEKALVAKL